MHSNMARASLAHRVAHVGRGKTARDRDGAEGRTAPGGGFRPPRRHSTFPTHPNFSPAAAAIPTSVSDRPTGGGRRDARARSRATTRPRTFRRRRRVRGSNDARRRARCFRKRTPRATAAKPLRALASGRSRSWRIREFRPTGRARRPRNGSRDGTKRTVRAGSKRIPGNNLRAACGLESARALRRVGCTYDT